MLIIIESKYMLSVWIGARKNDGKCFVAKKI